MPNVQNAYWKDPDDSEEIAAVLDDFAEQLDGTASTRRERAEVGRIRKAAAQLREQHDIPAPAPAVRNIRRAGGSAEHTEAVS